MYYTKINILFFMMFLSITFLNAQNINFEEHTVDLNFPGIQCIKAIDMDNDGDLDIVGGSEITQTSSSVGIAWWRNDGGYPIDWTRFTVDLSFEHVMSIDVGYIDSDSLLDIVATSWSLHQVAWWKNTGNPESSWSKTIVMSSYYNAHDAKIADIDLDGSNDIISCSSYLNSVDIFYNTNVNTPSWQRYQIVSNFSGAKSVEIIDLDFDKDLDIIGSADEANDIAWWENQGNNSQIWSKITIDGNMDGVAYTNIIDINGDFKYDIIGSGWSSNQIAYYICNNLEINDWAKSIVTTNLEIALKGKGFDFDQDGDIDIVALGKFPGKVVLFINEDFSWTEQTLRNNFNSAAGLAIADLDQDGDYDILAGAGGPGAIYWYENSNITSVNDEAELPFIFSLNQNFPNPFNSITKISYLLNRSSFVSVKVFDSLGKEVAELVNEEKLAGTYNEEFNASGLASGIYYIRLRTEIGAATKKIVLLK